LHIHASKKALIFISNSSLSNFTNIFSFEHRYTPISVVANKQAIKQIKETLKPNVGRVFDGKTYKDISKILETSESNETFKILVREKYETAQQRLNILETELANSEQKIKEANKKSEKFWKNEAQKKIQEYKKNLEVEHTKLNSDQAELIQERANLTAKVISLQKEIVQYHETAKKYDEVTSGLETKTNQLGEKLKSEQDVCSTLKDEIKHLSEIIRNKETELDVIRKDKEDLNSKIASLARKIEEKKSLQDKFKEQFPEILTALFDMIRSKEINQLSELINTHCVDLQSQMDTKIKDFVRDSDLALDKINSWDRKEEITPKDYDRLCEVHANTLADLYEAQEKIKVLSKPKSEKRVVPKPSRISESDIESVIGKWVDKGRLESELERAEDSYETLKQEILNLLTQS